MLEVSRPDEDPVIRTIFSRLGRVVISTAVGLLICVQLHAATLWTAPSYVTRWGSAGMGPGQMRLPEGITTAPNGDVLVADVLNDRVDRFSATGSTLGSWPTVTGSGALGIACDADGNVFVGTSNGFIEVHAPDGTLLFQWSVTSTPRGLAIDRTAKRLYVAIAYEIRVFDLQGNLVTSWPWPYDNFLVQCVAVAPDGSVYAATLNGIVGHWSASGLPIAYINRGSLGQGGGVPGLAVDETGLLYVSDPESDRIQVYTSAFALVGQWGSQGSGPDQFVGRTRGIAIKGPIIYVGDYQASQILEFADATTPTIRQSWGQLKSRFQ